MAAMVQEPLSRGENIPMDVQISRDGDGYLASIEWIKNLFAYGYTREEAKSELVNVIDMMIDYNLDEIQEKRQVKSRILRSVNTKHYAL